MLSCQQHNLGARLLKALKVIISNLNTSSQNSVKVGSKNMQMVACEGNEFHRYTNEQKTLVYMICSWCGGIPI